MMQITRRSLRSLPAHMTQSGHERAAFAAMHGPDLLYLIVILGLGVSPHEAVCQSPDRSLRARSTAHRQRRMRSTQPRFAKD